ncbi:MAG: hypothetical protein ACHP7D_08585, partial [Lysobacterales bacterium]
IVGSRFAGTDKCMAGCAAVARAPAFIQGRDGIGCVVTGRIYARRGETAIIAGHDNSGGFR